MRDRESGRIRRMFGRIAPRYDRANRLLSLSVDRRWRRLTRRELEGRLPPDPRILDLCTGTGDLALELSGLGSVVACDFSHPMLVLGMEKASRSPAGRRIAFTEGDALRLPFPDRSFDAVSIAFGLRNLESYRQGLAEMHRVLRPGGVLVVLEFTLPTSPLFRSLYLFYFVRILPRLGGWISGHGQAYAYLSRSVRQFLSPADLDRLLESSGFEEVRHRTLSAGIACLHLGRKPDYSFISGKRSRQPS